MSMNGPMVPHGRSAAAVGIDDDANDKNTEDGQTVRTNSTMDVSHHTRKRSEHPSKEGENFEFGDDDVDPPITRRRMVQEYCCSCTRASTCSTRGCECRDARQWCGTCECKPRCSNHPPRVSSETGAILRCWVAAGIIQPTTHNPAPMEVRATLDTDPKMTAQTPEPATQPAPETMGEPKEGDKED